MILMKYMEFNNKISFNSKIKMMMESTVLETIIMIKCEELKLKMMKLMIIYNSLDLLFYKKILITIIIIVLMR